MHKNDWPKHAKLLQPQASLAQQNTKTEKFSYQGSTIFRAAFPVLVTNLNGKLFSRGG